MCNYQRCVIASLFCILVIKILCYEKIVYSFCFSTVKYFIHVEYYIHSFMKIF